MLLRIHNCSMKSTPSFHLYHLKHSWSFWKSLKAYSIFFKKCRFGENFSQNFWCVKKKKRRGENEEKRRNGGKVQNSCVSSRETWEILPMKLFSYQISMTPTWKISLLNRNTVQLNFKWEFYFKQLHVCATHRRESLNTEREWLSTNLDQLFFLTLGWIWLLQDAKSQSFLCFHLVLYRSPLSFNLLWYLVHFCYEIQAGLKSKAEMKLHVPCLSNYSAKKHLTFLF